ncbi:MAG: class I SAM-dependent methyltransferase [Spirochaetia bacterium]|nr:class I SAM-dependent methyltransferase [Spirochaetia bacterium]
MTWEEYYKDRVNNVVYLQKFYHKYKPFLDTVALKINSSDIVYCIGGGIGTELKALLRYYPKNIFAGKLFYVVDNSWEMLQMASINLSKVSNSIHYLQADLLDIHPEISDLIKAESYSLVISHGVLEHFTNKEIASIIKSFPTPQVHYVPLNKYNTPSFGDERLLTQNYWNNSILKGFKKELESFNDEYDLIIKIN